MTDSHLHLERSWLDRLIHRHVKIYSAEDMAAADAARDQWRNRCLDRQAAIDRAMAALEGSQYVGGPTEREAYQTAVHALGPFRTEHKGQNAR